MSNKEIARILAEIGDMLEIIDHEKDHFRIIAYENAARKIEMMSEEIDDIYRRSGVKGLKGIRGIGETISQTIEEIIRIKKSYYHDQLVKKVPKPILEFIRIPGVGPHTALDIYNSYKTKSILELKKKVVSDDTERFFKEKTKQNILEGIELLSRQTGRMTLAFAEPIASEALAALKEISEVKQANAVGSLRRMTETVGDIDIIASLNLKSQISNLKISEKIINNFIHQPFVERIISHGDTKATIVHKKGPNIDLEILPSDQYGSLLQHFTGSKEHNVALRTWAEKHGFSISEHGIKSLRGKSQNTRYPSKILGASKIQTNSKTQIIKCSNEEKVYKTLRMDFIPPELRENQGEIEAALNHNLPDLIEQKDIKGDLHLHSTWSEGEMSIDEVALATQKLGYHYIAMTDHTAGLGITHGLKEKDIPKYIKQIQNLNLKFQNHNAKFKILSGAEVNILADGSLDISNKTLAKLDLVIASIHSGFRQSREKITARVIKAIQNPNVDVIAHPLGRLIEKRQPLNLDWQKIFRSAGQYNVAMEINCHPDRLDLNDQLIRMAKDFGIKFVISTDSHHSLHFQNMRYGVAMARRGWLEKNDVLNCYTLQQLLTSIKK